MGHYKVQNNQVYETQTKQNIKRFENKKDAINLCNLLNSGAGFNGYTPAFMLIQIPKGKV